MAVHRKKVLETIKQSSMEELEQWKKHVLFCLDFYKRDQNSFEIDECEYLLSHIDEQMKHLSGRD